jgi:glycosyltransferase involved in cell wall biosynthesis
MLEALLALLETQVSRRPVEVIVVDNCPDESARPVQGDRHSSTWRYIHEPQSGVVHARNRGVRAARGTYVILLDDDEVPGPGWLDAWLTQADGVTDASFGRITPRLLGSCAPENRTQVERIFSRDLRRPSGVDISDRWAFLGTGNAMFHKARCLGPADPFDLRFNARGGEDVWLIRGLVKKGRRLLWNHEAVVDELVTEDRMTLDSLRLRRFNQGQLRGILMYGEGSLAGLASVSAWMLAGTIQWLGYSIAAALASVVAPQLRADFLCRASGGSGKMLWWREARLSIYGATHAPVVSADTIA